MPFVKKNDSRSSQPPTDSRNFFIGRMEELHFFVQNVLKPADPTYNIISISGQGGVGKSTLLARFIDEVHSTNFKDSCLAAIVDERQATPASIMEKFADQLRITGKFERALKQYKGILRKLQSERETMQDTILRSFPDFAGAAAESVPIAGPLLREGTKVGTKYLLGRYHTNQIRRDAEILEDPLDDLTKAFVEELNLLAETQVVLSITRVKQLRIILFFDTFEQLAIDVAPWLLNYFLEADINNHIVLLVAGRDPIEQSTPADPKRWLPYHDSNIIYSISLDAFTEEETRLYLTERGITDPTSITTIWRLSGGLPLYLGLLTFNRLGSVDPSSDVVANFLRWIPEKEHIKRRLALDAALFSMPFSQDDLAAFTYLQEDKQEDKRTALYRWLIKLPFVRSNSEDGRHRYHDLAREMFRRNLYQRSQKEYFATRRALAIYYKQLLEQTQKEGTKEINISAEWLELTLALAYQLFYLPDEACHIEGIEHVLNTSRHATQEQNKEIARFLRDVSYEQQNSRMSTNGLHVASQLLRFIEAHMEGQQKKLIEAADDLLRKVDQKATFSSMLLAWLYERRGAAYVGLNEYLRALQNFDHAIELDPRSAAAYLGRGFAYQYLKDYQQAITDLDHAIELDPNNSRAYTARGLYYFERKDYQQAITDLDHAIELDPKYVWAYVTRARPYRRLKDYQRAIVDYDRALELDPEYISAYNNRGFTYAWLKDYQRAIADYDRALELDPKYVWTYVARGMIYCTLGDYQRAIADYNRALEIDPESARGYTFRGFTYAWLKDYQRAIADYERALELDPEYARSYIYRGATYCMLEDFQRSIVDLDRALKLGPEYYALAHYYRGITHLFLKDTKQAKSDFLQAPQLDGGEPSDSAYINARWMATWIDICQEGWQPAVAESLEAIAAIDPQHYLAHLCRGIVLFLHKRSEEAMTKIEQAIASEMKNWEAYFWKGIVCASLGRNEDAIASIEQSLKKDLPPVLLTPLRWLEQIRPEFYEQYVTSLLARYNI